MQKEGRFIICVSNSIGAPLYKAKLELSNSLLNKTFESNLCGIASIEVPYGEYVLRATADEFKERRFKIKIYDKCSFLSLNLECFDNKIFGNVDGVVSSDTKIKLLYEVSEGKYIKVKECGCDADGKYVFTNIPKGKYKIRVD